MTYQSAEITNGVYALAIWDEAWNSFNNCYLVLRRDAAIMIDAGKREHTDALIAGLAACGTAPSDVTTLFLTHGHHDHVGGSIAFSKAAKFIHPEDAPHLPSGLRPEFSMNLLDAAERHGFDCSVLGHHTEGSVALYDRTSGVLFTGDHLAFFGDPLPAEGLVAKAPELRERAYRFVSGLAHDPADRERLGPAPFHRFVDGLVSLRRFGAATAWCTGHGAVLIGDIGTYINTLITCMAEIRQ